MKNSELLELVGKKVSFEVHEDIHIGENKTITCQAGLSGELTCVVFTPDNVVLLLMTVIFLLLACKELQSFTRIIIRTPASHYPLRWVFYCLLNYRGLLRGGGGGNDRPNRPSKNRR